jgi:hypothetical protein
MLSTGAAHALAMDDDGNGDVAEPRLQRLPLDVGPRFDRLIAAAQSDFQPFFTIADEFKTDIIGRPGQMTQSQVLSAKCIDARGLKSVPARPGPLDSSVR